MPLPNVTAPESGRSFGIAIALVILLILFTLALSIVLRPRHRAAPVELSWNITPCYEVVSSSVPASISAPTASRAAVVTDV